MAESRLSLIAPASKGDLVHAIASSLPITGLFVPGRSRIKDPPTRLSLSVDPLLVEGNICCFLAPYPALKRDVERALASGTHVLCAGPLPVNRAEFDRICSIGQHCGLHFAQGPKPRHSLLHKKLLEQRHAPAFGSPVFLRWVSGGGDGLLPSWWAVCRALEQAAELLDDEIEEMRLAAVRRGRRHHLVLTVGAAGGATAQLAVAPFHLSPVPDIALLGTGGLLSSASLSSASPVATRRGFHLLPSPEQWPEVVWLEECINRMSLDTLLPPPTWPSVAYHRTLLNGLRRAIRTGTPQPIPGP